MGKVQTRVIIALHFDQSKCCPLIIIERFLEYYYYFIIIPSPIMPSLPHLQINVMSLLLVSSSLFTENVRVVKYLSRTG